VPNILFATALPFPVPVQSTILTTLSTASLPDDVDTYLLVWALVLHVPSLLTNWKDALEAALEVLARKTHAIIAAIARAMLFVLLLPLLLLLDADISRRE
jgi:hypothetical protein